MGKQEEEKQLEELFENLFKYADIKEGMNLIKESLDEYEKKGYDVSKYKKRYFGESQKYPELKYKLN